MRKLEALSAKGDTDDSDAKNERDNEVSKGKCKSAEYEPNKVCKRMCTEVTVYMLTEGCKHEAAHLEALNAEGDTYNGNAPNDTEKRPNDSRRKTCGDKPEKIADKSHKKVLQKNDMLNYST